MVWLGKTDPVLTIEVGRADDPERLERLEFLTALAGESGTGPHNAATVHRMISETTKEDYYGNLGDRAVARNALNEILQRFVNKYGVIDAKD